MTISDLLDKKTRGIFTDDAVLKCGLIALDAKDGKVLFDTEKNKREYIEKFKTGEVIALWADMRKRSSAWDNYFVPVMKCYVSHDSWKEGGSEMRGLCENCIHQEVCDFYRQEGADGFTMNCPFHKEERPHGNWEYLKEHITEMRDDDGKLNQKQTCQFILYLMGVIEEEGDRNENR